MGLHRADHTRPDLARLLLPGWESTLHRQLRDSLDLVPSQGQWTVAQVQAVVILAQLERERGRDHSARLYLDSALQMIKDIQDTQDVLDMLVSDDELVIRRMTLRAASLLHSHWTIFDRGLNLDQSSSNRRALPLGQGAAPISRRRHRHLHGNAWSSTAKHDLDSQIYNAHLDLMGIVADAADELAYKQSSTRVIQDPFSQLTPLHRRLKSWYAGLPTHLRWNDQSKHSAPPSLFLLHQQYRAIQILLFRPFTSPESFESLVPHMEGGVFHQLSVLIPRLIFTSAVEIATLLAESIERFEPGAILHLAVQQGALAASILLSSMQHIEDGGMRNTASRQLDSLQRFFSAMSAVQGPAERLARTLLDHRGAVDETSPHIQNRRARERSQARNHPGSEGYIHLTAGDGDEGTFWRCGQSEREGSSGHSLGQGTGADIIVSPDAGGHHTVATIRDSDDLDLTASPGDRGGGPDLSSTTEKPSDDISPRGHIGNGHATVPSLIPASSHGIPRSSSPFTPEEVSLAPADSLADQFASSIEEQSLLPIVDPVAPVWDDDDAVTVSWSETFKALGALNQRTAGEKMSANEFGDVMGCVFQL
ncbi:hypothetical protein PV04_01740 [Phialophora macrospora]|uniref:Transcription factor domain-containing protein n=1 Tax=Phialophora macrospora TaxID=1851006 RepID=A0A0D2D7U2_9EURO|nr:hypothetical protein PV04_01740 [Phialophora macrospora]